MFFDKIVVCDPPAVRQILSDTKTFVKGDEYRRVFSVVFGDGLVTSTSEKHKRDRAFFGKYFIKSNIENYVGIMNKVWSFRTYFDKIEDLYDMLWVVNRLYLSLLTMILSVKVVSQLTFIIIITNLLYGF